MKSLTIVFISLILVVPSFGLPNYLGIEQVPPSSLPEPPYLYPSYIGSIEQFGTGLENITLIPIEKHKDSIWLTWTDIVNSRVYVGVKDFIYQNPPDTTNVKVADLYVDDVHYDVIADYHYFTEVSPTVGGIVDNPTDERNIFRLVLDSEPPYNEDGTPFFIKLSSITSKPEYEFVEWSGKAVDLGYTMSQTSSPAGSDLFLDMYNYFEAVNEQCYIKGLFGIPTEPGIDVSVLFPGEGISLVFDEVTSAGHAILDYAAGPDLPDGYQLGESGAFDIFSTAGFSGMVQIAVDYSEMGIISEDMLQLMHYYDGAWYDCTTSIDTINNIIYGRVDSLSPFAVVSIPAPGAILLGSIGIGLVGWMRRRKSL